MPGRIAQVLFDLDGTLADTAADLTAALNRVLDRRACPPLDVATLRPHVSQGGSAMIRFAFAIDESDARFAELKREFLSEYGAAVAHQTTLFDGTESLLTALESAGYAWGVVTNKQAAFTLPLVEALGLLPRAACVVSGDTTAHLKPHPEPLLHACRLLGCEPRAAVYVGDAQRDAQAAQAAGMPCVIAGYGYIDGSDPLAWGAAAVIAHPRELLPWLAATS